MWFKRQPYRVKLKGRTGLVYEENGKSMLVDSEMLAGPTFDIVIYTDSLKGWQPPHEHESLTEGDKARIKENISKALSNLRIDWA
jgi:hypothetical protein